MLIGVGHQKGNGKTEVCKILTRELGLPLDGFALPIKRLVADTFGMTLEDVERWKDNPAFPPGWHRTMRDALQTFGETAHSFCPRVWLNKAANKPAAVFQDWRYLDYARELAEAGHMCVMVVRPSHANDDCSEATHVSERELTPLRLALMRRCPKGGPTGHPWCQYLIVNDSTLFDLEEKVVYQLIPFIKAHYAAR